MQPDPNKNFVNQQTVWDEKERMAGCIQPLVPVLVLQNAEEGPDSGAESVDTVASCIVVSKKRK